MLTPSSVFAYWMRGSIVASWYTNRFTLDTARR